MVELLNKKTAFHVHTNFSYDSNLKPEDLVDFLIKNDFEQVIITDHDEIEGALEARNYAESKYGNEFKVIIGEEVSTNIGDVIGFPLTKKIIAKDVKDCFRQIKEQGGFICLPHPYKGHDLFQIHQKWVIDELDFVEIFNARLNPKLNSYAFNYAKFYKKMQIIGSDAHLISELNNTSFRFKTNFNHLNAVHESYASIKDIRKSQFIKYNSRNDYLKCLKYFILQKINM
tara:strand:- start:981 stop:1667 length:687 start_codon:yes stop_codon:yes gene_type:complete